MNERKILKLQEQIHRRNERNRKSSLEHQSNNDHRQDPVIDTEISGQSLEKSILWFPLFGSVQSSQIYRDRKWSGSCQEIGS